MATFFDYLKNIFLIILILQIAPPLVRNIIQQYSKMLEPQTKIGYITIKGFLCDSQYYVRYLKKFFSNDDIKAILLRIDSPGGAAGSSEAIAHEIDILKKEHPKPVITLTENICTSGAYYIASSTDYIIAAPSTLVGSIGTSIPYQFKIKDILEKLDIKYYSITAGKYKNTTDPLVEMTSEKKALLQELADDSYQNFLQYVTNNRSQLSLDEADTWANGKIFTGNLAHKHKLIDKLGSLSDAISIIKERAIVEGEIEWIKPEKSSSLLSLLFGGTNDQTELHSFSFLTKLMHGLYYAFSPFCKI